MDQLGNMGIPPHEPGSPSSDGSIPLCVPEIQGNEWTYVKECLDTNWVSSVGSYVDRFEEMLAGYIGANHAVATVNGTAALHIALMVAGVEADDEVLVSDLTFVAPANAISYIGAWPVFMDVDPSYWQMDPQKVAEFLDNECQWKDGRLINKTSGRRVKAVLPVHILGHPCDMDPVVEVAKKYELAVVEDATESLGATYKGQMVGSSGDIACYSFNGNKLITTGGGGMIVTDNQQMADRAKYLTTQAKDDGEEYIHDEIGYNYRLTNIQAAMGVAQMEMIDDFIEKKRTIAKKYLAGLNDDTRIVTMPHEEWADPTYWLYTVLLQPGTGIESRKSVVRELNQNGVGARPLWHTLHDLKPYQDCQAYRIECSIDLYHRGISLPSSVGLNDLEQSKTIANLKAAVGG